MMISICIPVFNYDICSLHNQLSEQISELKGNNIELIVIDDHSEEEYRSKNRQVCKDDLYVELTENVGRSRIRNMFAGYSGNKYLLFLDCDSIVGYSGFLKKYLEVIEQGPGVVCGGSIYTKDPPERYKMLRWKYGTFRESKSAFIRRKDPYRAFMTNNFLIDRNIFERIRFDERLSGYGYEDTLFSYSLRKSGIKIDHIENPVINGGLENNADYLAKTHEAIVNLVEMLRSGVYDNEITEYITLLDFYKKVKRYNKSIAFTYSLFRPVIVNLLSRGFVNLRLYDFYKLGTFNHLHGVESLRT